MPFDMVHFFDCCLAYPLGSSIFLSDIACAISNPNVTFTSIHPTPLAITVRCSLVPHDSNVAVDVSTDIYRPRCRASALRPLASRSSSPRTPKPTIPACCFYQRIKCLIHTLRPTSSQTPASLFLFLLIILHCQPQHRPTFILLPPPASIHPYL